MLQYLCTTCRPELSFPTKELGRYNSCYNHDAWLQARRVAIYTMHSARDGLTFRRDPTRSFTVEAFVDADYNGTPEERLSTTGFFCTIAGMPISWVSRTQKCCARSVAEAEFVALSTCTAEVLYLRQFLCELGLNGNAVPIHGAAHAHHPAVSRIGLGPDVQVPCGALLGPLHSMRRLLSWLRIDRMHLSGAFQITRRLTTSTTFDRIHHTTRESFWRKQGELTRRMRNDSEAATRIHADHKNTFMWQQCGLPREGLITFEEKNLVHRAAASCLATPGPP